jgi:hypothetical protein
MSRLLVRLADSTFLSALTLILLGLAGVLEAAFAGANSMPRLSTAPAPLIGLGIPAAAGAVAVVVYLRRLRQRD